MEEVEKLRNTILNTFGLEGLHIAEAVQNEVLSTYIGINSPTTQRPADLTKRIEKMLNEVDKYIVYISVDDRVEQKIREIETRIYADVPDTLILYGCRAGAITKVRSIATKLKKSISMKTYRFTASESHLKIIVVISKETSVVTSSCKKAIEEE